jgi:hypothetical protein
MANLTIDTFKALEGKTLNLVLNGERFPFHLERIVSTGSKPMTSQSESAPFSLHFRNNSPYRFNQATYTFEADGLDTAEIFIVAIGQTDDGIEYQAVFT